MNVILFGATGMVGQGVLRECLLDPSVERVTTVGRQATGQSHAKLRDLVVPDLTSYAAIERELTGFNACFYSLGVSVFRMSEDAYTRITYELTLAAAQTLARLNPAMTFVYVSGQGTDSTERGRAMWARVKGKTENALRRLPFKACYLFRPGLIEPMHGIRSKTFAYRAVYALIGPIMPALKSLFPSSITTTEQIGRAMIKVARSGAPKQTLENADINAL